MFSALAGRSGPAPARRAAGVPRGAAVRGDRARSRVREELAPAPPGVPAAPGPARNRHGERHHPRAAHARVRRRRRPRRRAWRAASRLAPAARRRQAARRAYVENLVPTFVAARRVRRRRRPQPLPGGAGVLAGVPARSCPGCCSWRRAGPGPRTARCGSRSSSRPAWPSSWSAAVAGSLVLPRFGVAQPLARGPMVVLVNEVLGLLDPARRPGPGADRVRCSRTGCRRASGRHCARDRCAAVRGGRRRGSRQPRVRARCRRSRCSSVSGLLLVGLLFASAAGAAVGAARRSLRGRASAVIYSYSLAGDRLFGWDIQEEFRAFSLTMQAGSWTPAVHGDPYRAMLSITALPTVLARVTGISGVSILLAGRRPAPASRSSR